MRCVPGCRYAQQTDAGQLTRSLLLAPRGTVNVKPNLQIIADDVKCTHGAAISDLDDEQLFYFQARGIDATAARSALVFSFAAEVLCFLFFGWVHGEESLCPRATEVLRSQLLKGSSLAGASSVPLCITVPFFMEDVLIHEGWWGLR